MHSQAQITSESAAPTRRSPLESDRWQRFASEARQIARYGREGAWQRAHLVQEHRDLDELIAVLAADPGTEDALIVRLKKRKLGLRDEIARLDAGAGSELLRAPP